MTASFQVDKCPFAIGAEPLSGKRVVRSEHVARDPRSLADGRPADSVPSEQVDDPDVEQVKERQCRVVGVMKQIAPPYRWRFRKAVGASVSVSLDPSADRWRGHVRHPVRLGDRTQSQADPFQLSSIAVLLHAASMRLGRRVVCSCKPRSAVTITVRTPDDATPSLHWRAAD